MFQRFLQASGDAFWSMVSLIAGALTNIILDPIFIFQFNLGIAGAAWATIIGQWISALAAIYLNHTKNPNIRPQFPLQISSKAIQDIYRVGAPAIAVQASQSVMAAGLNAILLPVSSSAVAFLSVYIKLQSFLFMPLNGLGQAAIPIIGFNSGAKRMDRAKQCQRTVLKSGILLSVICALAFFFFSKPLLTLFSLEGEALNLGIQAMKVLALTFPMGAITLLLGNCASGLQNGIINLAGTILRQIFPLLPLCQWFLSLGIHNMWYAFLPSEAIALITTTILSTRLWKKRTQNEKVPGLQA
jgi:putative MATE family efflux protein